jgi:hypothetical protein
MQRARERFDLNSRRLFQPSDRLEISTIDQVEIARGQSVGAGGRVVYRHDLDLVEMRAPLFPIVGIALALGRLPGFEPLQRIATRADGRGRIDLSIFRGLDGESMAGKCRRESVKMTRDLPSAFTSSTNSNSGLIAEVESSPRWWFSEAITSSESSVLPL